MPGPHGGRRGPDREQPWDERRRHHQHAWDEQRHHEQPWDEEARPPFPPGPPGPPGAPPAPPGPPGAPPFEAIFPPEPPGRGFVRGGPGGPFGGWFGRGGGGRPKVGRGDVRAAILLLLYERRRNGYQIITEIEQRSNGVWRPSPGSVYPALSQLEDEGLVQALGDGKSKFFTLTETGQSYVEANEIDPPWDAIAGSVDDEMSELQSIVGQVTMAAMQVARVGSDVQRARRILIDTRKQLYRILAEDDEEEET